MRLAQFIRANIALIATEWESFARTRTPAAHSMNTLALRDHIVEILEAIAADIETVQSLAEQRTKSQGDGIQPVLGIDSAAQTHAAARVADGFTIEQMASEYRALRACVIRLWGEALPQGVSANLNDVTRFNESIDQALAESLARFSQKLNEGRALLLGILGHDLRDPLSAIANCANVLTSQGDLDKAAIRSIADRITASTARMGRVVANLLDLTRTRLGSKFPITPVPTDLRVLCSTVLNEVKATEPALSVQLECQGDLCGEWDSAWLGQMLSNLVLNAVQHGAADRPVVVTIHGDPERVVLTVHNDGEPIPDKDAERIFDSLVRGPESRGLGLGLFIARQVATAHGGDLQVSSSAAGGTTFTACLPRHTAT